jgi:hypothetical protein
MITTRAEVLALLAAPQVQAALKELEARGGGPGGLADAFLEAAGLPEDQPVGARWDAVDWTLVNQLGIRPIGHVGRAPTLSLEAWEGLLSRLLGWQDQDTPG